MTKTNSKTAWVLVGQRNGQPFAEAKSYKTNMLAWMAGKKLLKKMYPDIPSYDSYKDSNLKAREVTSHPEYLEFDGLSYFRNGVRTFQYFIYPVGLP